MTDNFLILRNGCGPWAYIGQCGLSDYEIRAKLRKDPILLEDAYMLYTITVPIGPGKVAQESHIFPIDNSFEKVGILSVVADSAYRPSEATSKQLRRMVDTCEGYLSQARSGLVSPHH
jgi:hypothetical protein